MQLFSICTHSQSFVDLVQYSLLVNSFFHFTSAKDVMVYIGIGLSLC